MQAASGDSTAPAPAAAAASAAKPFFLPLGACDSASERDRPCLVTAVEVAAPPLPASDADDLRSGAALELRNALLVLLSAPPPPGEIEGHAAAAFARAAAGGLGTHSLWRQLFAAALLTRGLSLAALPAWSAALRLHGAAEAGAPHEAPARALSILAQFAPAAPSAPLLRTLCSRSPAQEKYALRAQKKLLRDMRRASGAGEGAGRSAAVFAAGRGVLFDGNPATRAATAARRAPAHMAAACEDFAWALHAAAVALASDAGTVYDQALATAQETAFRCALRVLAGELDTDALLPAAPGEAGEAGEAEKGAHSAASFAFGSEATTADKTVSSALAQPPSGPLAAFASPCGLPSAAASRPAFASPCGLPSAATPQPPSSILAQQPARQMNPSAAASGPAAIAHAVHTALERMDTETRQKAELNMASLFRVLDATSHGEHFLVFTARQLLAEIRWIRTFTRGSGYASASAAKPASPLTPAAAAMWLVLADFAEHMPLSVTIPLLLLELDARGLIPATVRPLAAASCVRALVPHSEPDLPDTDFVRSIEEIASARAAPPAAFGYSPSGPAFGYSPSGPAFGYSPSGPAFGYSPSGPASAAASRPASAAAPPAPPAATSAPPLAAAAFGTPLGTSLLLQRLTRGIMLLNNTPVLSRPDLLSLLASLPCYGADPALIASPGAPHLLWADGWTDTAEPAAAQAQLAAAASAAAAASPIPAGPGVRSALAGPGIRFALRLSAAAAASLFRLPLDTLRDADELAMRTRLAASLDGLVLAAALRETEPARTKTRTRSGNLTAILPEALQRMLEAPRRSSAAAAAAAAPPPAHRPLFSLPLVVTAAQPGRQHGILFRAQGAAEPTSFPAAFTSTLAAARPRTATAALASEPHDTSQAASVVDEGRITPPPAQPLHPDVAWNRIDPLALEEVLAGTVVEPPSPHPSSGISGGPRSGPGGGSSGGPRSGAGGGSSGGPRGGPGGGSSGGPRGGPGGGGAVLPRTPDGGSQASRGNENTQPKVQSARTELCLMFPPGHPESAVPPSARLLRLSPFDDNLTHSRQSQRKTALRREPEAPVVAELWEQWRDAFASSAGPRRPAAIALTQQLVPPVLAYLDPRHVRPCNVPLVRFSVPAADVGGLPSELGAHFCSAFGHPVVASAEPRDALAYRYLARLAAANLWWNGELPSAHPPRSPPAAPAPRQPFHAAHAALVAQCEAAGLSNLLHLPCVHPEVRFVPLSAVAAASRAATLVYTLAVVVAAFELDLHLCKIEISGNPSKKVNLRNFIYRSSLLRILAESAWMAVAYFPDPLPDPTKDHNRILFLRALDLPCHRAVALVPDWHPRTGLILSPRRRESQPENGSAAEGRAQPGDRPTDNGDIASATASPPRAKKAPKGKRATKGKAGAAEAAEAAAEAEAAGAAGAAEAAEAAKAAEAVAAVDAAEAEAVDAAGAAGAAKAAGSVSPRAGMEVEEDGFARGWSFLRAHYDAVRSRINGYTALTDMQRILLEIIVGCLSKYARVRSDDN